MFGLHVKESGPLRAAHPFVTVSGVIIRAEALEAQRQHPGCMGTIDQHFYTPFLYQRDQSIQRQDEPGQARHMIDK